MGVSQSSQNLQLYGKAQHPVLGSVMAFQLKGQGGIFVMKTSMKLKQKQIQLLEKVGKGEKCQKIVQFYGREKIETNGQNKQAKEDQGGEVKDRYLSPKLANSIEGKQKEMQTTMYWEYLNWDINQQIQHLKQKNQLITQECLWEILDNALQASLRFKQFGIYIDFRPKNIEFTAGKQPKIFWCNILPQNMHRGYQHFLFTGQFRHTVYAPEQLLQIKRTQKSSLNKQKSTIFMLGLTLLQAITKQNTLKIYNYQLKSVSQVKKRQLLSLIKGKYSAQFQRVLCSCLQYFPKDRYAYKDLQFKLDQHYNRLEVQDVQIDINQTRTQFYTNTNKDVQSDVLSRVGTSNKDKDKQQKQNMTTYSSFNPINSNMELNQTKREYLRNKKQQQSRLKKAQSWTQKFGCLIRSKSKRKDLSKLSLND